MAQGAKALQEVGVFRAIGLGIVTKQHPFDRGCDRTFYATLALTVEHRFSNPGVIGSNPIGSLFYGSLALMVERGPVKATVVGSNPARSAIF